MTQARQKIALSSAVSSQVQPTLQPKGSAPVATPKSVQILGTRGIPGNHGGFETFAQQLAEFLVERGWKVTVYCQLAGEDDVRIDEYNGIRRVLIYTKTLSAASSIYFDWVSTRMASRQGDLVLTLGYNTAIFSLLYRLKRVRNLINMDGLEWKRAKWSWPARTWLYLNERFGCLFGNHLIADHPEIARHLRTRTSGERISVIPYGSDKVEDADESLLKDFDIEKGRYAVVIARAEPENSILEIVRAWGRSERDMKLVVLGNYVPENVEFHRQVIDAADDDVLFPGAIYDKATVEALRQYAALYIHGHQVGGTNPSLVEALGCGTPVLCHDNPFNRWVAGSSGFYFKDEIDCATQLDACLHDNEALIKASEGSRYRHGENFRLNANLSAYESLLTKWQGSGSSDDDSSDVKTAISR